MTRFVVGEDRSQGTLFPERMDDYLGEPEATGRPAYHPATLLKIYVYGYLNRVQSSRRLDSSRRNS
jgi:transposase